MEIIFSLEFKKQYNKVRDKSLREKLIKHISKLKQDPSSGKPLKHELKNSRSIRMPPFRIIYKIENNKIIIVTFGNREDIYEKFK